MVHIVLWGAWYGSHNIGDQALLLSIVDLLGEALGDVRFTVMTDNPEHVLRYGKAESRYPIDALHNRRQLPEVLRRLATCDLLVFGGGVSFFPERMHLLAMALIVATARLGRTPYMTWAVSSQEGSGAWARRLFGWVLNGAAAITYRDQHTHDLFRASGVTKTMQLVGDPAFWLEMAGGPRIDQLIKRAGQRDESRPLVALTPRTLRSRDGEAETHYRPKSEAQYEQELACFTAAVDWLWENGYQPIFIPMNTVAPDDDRIAAREIRSQAWYGSQALLVDEEVRPREAPCLYQRCQASFVARVHGSVTSALGGCPPMMYAFAPKHVGIMASMGLEGFALREAAATRETTTALLADLLAHRDEALENFARRLPVLRQESLIPARLAAEILKKK